MLPIGQLISDIDLQAQGWMSCDKNVTQEHQWEKLEDQKIKKSSFDRAPITVSGNSKARRRRRDERWSEIQG